MTKCNIACYPELVYEGHVRVSIARGKRVIKSYEYKNAGGPRLFNFLANCAAGNFFDNDRPTRIILFKSQQEGDGTVYTPISTSSGLFYSSAPMVIKNTVEEQMSGIFYQTTLHFTIPYYEIYENTVAGARLYSANALSMATFDQDDYSAAVIFDGGLELDPAGAQQNYMLIIDWELQFKNLSGADTPAAEMSGGNS